MPHDNNAALMMELAKKQLSQTMPAEVGAADVAPMGWFNKLLTGGRGSTGGVASTGPLNGIQYDPNVVNHLDQTSVNDLLAHELVHVRQNQRQTPTQNILDYFLEPLRSHLPYGQDPNELEALQLERDRALKEHRPTSFPMPGFQGPVRDQDINLSPRKK